MREPPSRRHTEATSRRPGRGQPRQPRVFKLQGENLVEVTVKLGINDGSYTQLLEGELSEGDSVIVGWDLATRGSGRRRRPGMF